MTTIRPFKAVRATAESAASVAALPYDVQNVAEAREIVAANPKSFLAIDEPVVNFPPGTDPFDLLVYLKAGSMLRDMKTRGDFTVDDQPSFYLYELTMDGRVQNGLVGCVAIDDYLNGIVKEHESTRVDKEVDRINHVRGCEAQTGPIFLAYHYDAELARLYDEAKAGEALFDFTADDGVRHRGFAMPADKAALIQERFDSLGRVYIADGHHRIAAASEVAKARRVARGSSEPTEESDYFLAVLFADSELKIWPYERVVKDLNGLSEEEFLGELRARFEVAEIVAPEFGCEPFSILGANDPAAAEEFLKPHALGEFCVYLGKRWYRCRIAAENIPDDPREGLEVQMLQRQLFAPVLGIADPRRSPRIDFVGGIRGLGELERRCARDCVAAFALSPTGIDELFAV
ncbi:MAG: DUF1015 domain-containing protein, partial [Eggerthellaceae bacterium]|nr:DUF1015 domain-containing protein [Eggerthellaceae bacterium]